MGACKGGPLQEQKREAYGRSWVLLVHKSSEDHSNGHMLTNPTEHEPNNGYAVFMGRGLQRMKSLHVASFLLFGMHSGHGFSLLPSAA